MHWDLLVSNSIGNKAFKDFEIIRQDDSLRSRL